MRERPILMSAPMVRALLAGTKTQTRREVKWRGLEPGLNLQFSGLSVERSGSNWVLTSPTRTSHEYRSVPQPCPYGQPGDRLCVRETYFAFGRWETRFSEKKGRDEWHFVDMTAECGLRYGFAEELRFTEMRKLAPRGSVSPCWWKRPAIFMPRAASRITLEITDVRVERLQEISEAAAQAEGIEWDQRLDPAGSCKWKHYTRDHTGTSCPIDSYSSLWDSINGAGSWDANPWVWAVSFRGENANA